MHGDLHKFKTPRSIFGQVKFHISHFKLVWISEVEDSSIGITVVVFQQGKWTLICNSAQNNYFYNALFVGESIRNNEHSLVILILSYIYSRKIDLRALLG